MSLTDIGIVAIDVVFAVAVLLAVSCLAYLVYATIREHAELKSIAREPATLDIRRPARSRTVRAYGRAPCASAPRRLGDTGRTHGFPAVV